MTSFAHYDHDRAGLWFSINVEKEEILAFITSDALHAHFKASRNKSSQLAAYMENRKVIETKALRQLVCGRPRPVKLGAADF